MEPINFHAASPIFRVSDLEKSLAYYNRVLGFATDWNYEGFFASVSRGSANVMLSQNDQGTFGAWVYIGVGDVVRLHEEFVGSGAIIKLAPANFSWAKEIHIADPDGNVIRFGSEPDPAPFDEWICWYD